MKRIISTGTPHSGTRYMAELFRMCRWNIGHETMGQHGTSCFGWATPDPEPCWSPGPRPSDLTDWTVFHVYRDPLLCIAAMAADQPGRLRRNHIAYLTRVLGARDVVLRGGLDYAARMYLIFNTEAARIADHTLNVEDAPEYLESIGMHVRRRPPTNMNTRAKGGRVPTTYEAIEAAAGAAITDAVRAMAEARGYCVEAAVAAQ